MKIILKIVVLGESISCYDCSNISHGDQCVSPTNVLLLNQVDCSAISSKYKYCLVYSVPGN